MGEQEDARERQFEEAAAEAEKRKEAEKEVAEKAEKDREAIEQRMNEGVEHLKEAHEKKEPPSLF